MRFYYKKRNKRLKRFLKEANRILENREFYAEIKKCTRFDNSEMSPAEISDLIQNYATIVQIKTWRNRWSRSNAAVNGKSNMKINLSKLNRSPKSIINTIIHEYVHCVDFGTGDKLRFTHFDNRNTNGDEDDTAPWAIGKIAEGMTIL